MQSRVTQLLSAQQIRGIMVSTFHNLGLHIIRSEIATLGFKVGFSILDQEDSRNILRELVHRRTELDDKLIDVIQSTISNWKSSLLSPEAAAKAASSTSEHSIAALYQQYQQAMRAYNAVDFDDAARPTFSEP